VFGGLLTVRVQFESADIVLTVADSGPGISAELRQRLFEPFSAGDAASGSGLGLTICREIVLSLGGTLTLDNRTDNGCVIGLDATVRLPRKKHLELNEKMQQIQG
jgi:two-component system sensor histidine kinase TctE